MVAQVVAVFAEAEPESGTAAAPPPAPANAKCSMVSVLVAVTITPRTPMVSGTAFRFDSKPDSLTLALLMEGDALPKGRIFWLPVPAVVRTIAIPARASSGVSANLMALSLPATGLA